jgi:hypothetical protein
VGGEALKLHSKVWSIFIVDKSDLNQANPDYQSPKDKVSQKFQISEYRQLPCRKFAYRDRDIAFVES